MNTDSFAVWARDGSEPLRADSLKIQTPDGLFEGHGTLRIDDEHFVLKVTLYNEGDLPRLSGVISLENFWKISGVLEDRLPFLAVGLAHIRHSHSGLVNVRQATFRLDRLSFVTERSASAENRSRELRQRLLGVTKESSPTVPSEEAAEAVVKHYAFARLTGHTVLLPNAGTNTEQVNDFLGKSTTSRADTFAGEIGALRYALIQVADDCEFHLIAETSELDQRGFRKALDAFLSAIAFLHGREAWPQHLRVKQNFVMLEEEITPKRNLPATLLALLTESACMCGKADFGKALKCAFQFFMDDVPIVKKTQRFLHLCRQSSLRKTPLDIGTLSLCSVFEGMIAAAYEHCRPNLPEEEISAFEYARDELLAYARSRREECEVFGRLLGVLRSIKPMRLEDQLERLAKYFGLPEEKMNSAVMAWKAERHPLAHGSEPSEKGDDRMLRQSRLAGAINLIAAKLMSYRGGAVFSVLEGQIVNI